MQEPRRAKLQPAALEAREDLAGEVALDGVRLGEDQRALDCHAADEISGSAGAARGGRFASPIATGRFTSYSIGVSQNGQTCHAASSGLPQFDARLPQLRRADRADEELLVDLGAADRAVEVARAEPPLHRLDLELALAHVLEVLRRAEQHVDQRPDERARRPIARHDTDDQLVRDAPAGVLEDPVDRRDPEDEHEEDREVAHDVPRRRVEEVVDAAERGRDHRRILPTP